MPTPFPRSPFFSPDRRCHRPPDASPISGHWPFPSSSCFGDSPSALLLRRGTSIASGGRLAAEGDSLELDLFSTTRFVGPPLGSGPGFDTLEGSLVELSKSVVQARVERSGVDDLLDAELGKHDYDWLLTPPGTHQTVPLVSSDSQVSAAAAKCTVIRSASTTRPSRD